MIKKIFRKWTLFVIAPLFMVGWLFILSYINLISFAFNYYDYLPKKFLFIKIVKVKPARKSMALTYLKGTIDEIEENYIPSDKDLYNSLIGQQGKVLDVLYNKNMTKTFIQGETLRVIDGTTTFISLLNVIIALSVLIYLPIILIFCFLYNKSIILFKYQEKKVNKHSLLKINY